MLWLALLLGLSSTQAQDLFIQNPSDLLALEKRGASFASLFEGAHAETLDALHQHSPGYRTFVATLEKDLETLRNSGPGYGPTMKHTRRTFDPRWLRSKLARMELAGVVLRMDRAFRRANQCGEFRLIYRLAYSDPKIGIYSRLPFTALQVRGLKKPCSARLKEWNGPNATEKLLAASDLIDLEVNFQSLRMPAGARPDMGGYAEYLMRVFEKTSANAWKAKTLENTLDVSRLQKDPRLKSKLLAWLREPRHIDSVDQGDALIPEEFLATQATSVAVHGLNRKANRIFSQVFAEKDFEGLEFSATSHLRSPRAYLRKLDELSCVGCHQTRSVAGFHFLGEDRSGSVEFNRIQIPFSNHFWNDQARRRGITEALRADGTPPRAALGFVGKPSAPHARHNEHCDLGVDPSFSAWKCGEGLRCEPIGSSLGTESFGICQRSPEGAVGDACAFGRVTEHASGRRDKETARTLKRCQSPLECLHPSDGYPGGLCFANFCDPKSGKACAALAVPGFNPCLARGRPFKECLERFTGSIDSAFCDLHTPCRDDFICARGFEGKGVCTPPYSLFQLRVDGHLPR